MKKLIIGVSLMIASSVVVAQGHHHHGGYHGGYRSYGGYNWVAPAIIGGAIGYAMSRPAPVIYSQPVYTQPPVVYTQPQVIYNQPPVVYNQPDQNIVYLDGVAYSKQWMTINGVQQEILVRR